VTPPEVRAAREREKELAELDRDIRTVFAYNLNLKAEEKDLFQFFSTAGKVLDVRIISDRNTRRSKGFAYIEYARRVSYQTLDCVARLQATVLCMITQSAADVILTDSLIHQSMTQCAVVSFGSTLNMCYILQEDIVNAMALTGQVLMGQSVMVKSSEVIGRG